MKILIITTKEGEVEYRDYWGRGNGDNDIIRNNGYIVFIIKGGALYNDEGTEVIGVEARNYITEIERILISQYELTWESIAEIGFASHTGGEVVECKEFEYKDKVKFNKSYGSTKSPDLWLLGFREKTCAGKLPFDRLRDAICNCKNVDFNVAFNEVWDYFKFDWLLEAKLEILHLCLTKDGIESAEKNINILLDAVEKNEATNIRNKFSEFYKIAKEAESCLDDKYVSALETLRDAMLAN